MKITILNGNANVQNPGFDEYIARLAAALTARQHTVTTFTLRDLDIKHCVGCFGCWTKTPGLCVAKDASLDVCRAAINSDFMLWAAPLRMGFPDAMLKKIMDKSVPLVHPYIVIDQGEAHHLARYERYPRVGLLVEKESDTDAEDLHIVGDIFSRTSLNFKSRLDFALTTEQSVEEVALAIVNQTTDGVPYARDLPPIPGVRINPPKQLTVFNGSPRGTKGNTPFMLEQLIKGFTAAGGSANEPFPLVRQNELDRYREAFAAAEAVLVGFPLYTDAMPGIVKTFIEALEPLRGRDNNPALGFMIQSGFPEATHLRHIERYLAKLADRLGSPYLGTIIKGGGEGVQAVTGKSKQKLFEQLYALGEGLGKTGQFDATILRELSQPERFPGYLMPIFKVLLKTPLVSGYFDRELKKNGVYEQRGARPLVEA
ncbi:MAG: flavodoxin family protein [Anaerolineae bacterium]|nr:flavodoxin family protein [Anaerolineae bacterium]